MLLAHPTRGVSLLPLEEFDSECSDQNLRREMCFAIRLRFLFCRIGAPGLEVLHRTTAFGGIRSGINYTSRNLDDLTSLITWATLSLNKLLNSMFRSWLTLALSANNDSKHSSGEVMEKRLVRCPTSIGVAESAFTAAIISATIDAHD